MITKAFITLVSLLLCTCAISPSLPPQLPNVKMEENRLVEPDYGYAVGIPEGWVRLDEHYIEKLDVENRKSTIQAIERLKTQGLRAWFLEPNLRASLQVFAAGYPRKTKDEVIAILRDIYKTALDTENKKRGYAHGFNLQFDSFEKLTDFHLSYEDADGFRYLLYVSTYPFRGAEYAVVLAFSARTGNFDSSLPEFYECVSSLSFPGRSPSHFSKEVNGNISERLKTLKQLKEKGLITEEDFERTKQQILSDL